MRPATLVLLVLLAQTVSAAPPGVAAGAPASARPALLREIGFDQRLDAQIQPDVPFLDDEGRPVTFGDYLGARPVVLAFVYYGCPMLCSQVANSLAGALDVMSLAAGRDFDVVVISFDPRDDARAARAKKAEALKRYHRAGRAAGWHFLTGDQRAIERITRAAGFRYVWDPGLQQFAHPAGIIVLTPEGRVARYLFGIDYGPRDLRLAIVEASQGTIGSPVDSFLLYCYRYDPTSGRYGASIMRLVRLSGVATVLGLVLLVGLMLKHERARSARRISRSAP